MMLFVTEATSDQTNFGEFYDYFIDIIFIETLLIKDAWGNPT